MPPGRAEGIGVTAGEPALHSGAEAYAREGAGLEAAVVGELLWGQEGAPGCAATQDPHCSGQDERPCDGGEA